MGHRLVTEAELRFFEDIGFRPNNYNTTFREGGYGTNSPQSHTRWVGRTAHGREWSETFQARLYNKGENANRGDPWVSPDFDDPISAYVYAQTMNWGQ